MAYTTRKIAKARSDTGTVHAAVPVYDAMSCTPLGWDALCGAFPVADVIVHDRSVAITCRRCRRILEAILAAQEDG